ncbi:DUF159-domain-containing protein [Auriscalpium vulgare]|uniref:DUF159-domain-containing protein n=1 Tax=Auriscalpium vulgare TaxID=40419 RepID=A0ACB8RJ58_9AGAM|nr:DUF159-domain-containing protein [Auriscalpium vulgare]
MCGRFALGLPADEVYQLHGYPALHAEVGEWVNQDLFVPRYNVAPNTQAPVLRRRYAGSSDATDASESGSSNLVLHTMKWGLIPHWSKSETTNLSTINARGENLVEGGGLWGSIKGKKRCIVLAQGYYEWLKKGKHRLPHFSRHKDDKLMLLAGLYDTATIEGRSEPLWTFTIVTTSANKDFEWLHDRQPVILTSYSDITTWLDTSSQTWTKDLSRLLDPYHDASSPLECYAVPKEVGKVGTESPTFIQPVSKRKDGIEAMFSNHTQSSPSGKPKLAPPSPAKRKREISPPAEPMPKSMLFEVDEESEAKGLDRRHSQAVVKSTTEPLVPQCLTTSTSPLQSPSTKKPRPQPSLHRKKQAKKGADSSAKITSFFSRAS